MEQLRADRVSAVLKFWSAEFVEKMMAQPMIEINQSAAVNTEDGEEVIQPESLGLPEQHAIIAEVYRYMMVGASFSVSLAHGANDVANSISPLLQVFQIDSYNDNWAYLIGGIGLGLGLLLMGKNVMETVGKKVVVLDFPKGFAAQYATATTVIMGTIFGLPLSTTHCAVGSLFGIILANKNTTVASVYDPSNYKKREP